MRMAVESVGVDQWLIFSLSLRFNVIPFRKLDINGFGAFNEAISLVCVVSGDGER